MSRWTRTIPALVAAAMCTSLCCCSTGLSSETEDTATLVTDSSAIEEALDLSNNDELEWTYDESADAWIMSIVSAVAYPEIEDEEGVSVCVPGAYVTGIDTDGDGTADVTSDTIGTVDDTDDDDTDDADTDDSTDDDTDATDTDNDNDDTDDPNTVTGWLVIDYDAEITSSNGQVYTAATAPVIINTGAAGYSSQENSTASTEYASEGYINVACGNRGKQDTATDDDGNEYYTGDAPSCLVDQKAATRFVKYNILLGNLPGSVDYFVSTGGSGGGAHAAMLAATGNNSDFYDYLIEVGAVGVYEYDDGTYSTTVTIDGTDYELSDSMWGCIAYSAITSLYEADMALAFEYYLDSDYDFSTSFQAQLAEYLSESYMEYINDQNLTVDESDVGFDLDGDGELNSTIDLTIEYDADAYPETNGYHGTYLDLYLAEFTESLQWYLDNLDYADGWTWFDEDGNALSDDEVAAMTTQDKAKAFIEGRYTASSSSDDMGAPGGGADIADGELPIGEAPDDAGGELPDGDAPDDADGELPDDTNSDDDEELVGTPDSGTTQSSTGGTDSADYDTYEDMLAAYQEDIEEIYDGDEYGNNIVALYNPLNYIGDNDTEAPTWTRIMMGASEGDMSLFSSLNLQIAWLDSGTDAEIEWQWDGGHVPSEILGESFSLYVDEMYGEYVDGAVSVTKQAADTQTANGTSIEVSGTDISSWVSLDDEGEASFSLADIAAYRTAGASKATPGFDVIDYGQEDYVFGDSDQDARHWDKYLLEILEIYQDVLEPLFNADSSS